MSILDASNMRNPSDDEMRAVLALFDCRFREDEVAYRRYMRARYGQTTMRVIKILFILHIESPLMVIA